MKKMNGDEIKTWLKNEFWFPQNFKLRNDFKNFYHFFVLRKCTKIKSLARGKIVLIVRFIMAVYWTIGWCYRLAHRKWPQVPYENKNITWNGTVIGTITVVEDIWFNDTTCEIEFNRDGKPGPTTMRYDMRTFITRMCSDSIRNVLFMCMITSKNWSYKLI